MKILRAEKFNSRKHSESQRSESETTLRKTDWEVLEQIGRFTGKQNFRSTVALNDPASVKRLMEAGMIYPNGKLTAKGRQKCDGLVQELMNPESESAGMQELPNAEQSGELEDNQFDKLTASDWAVLMKYNRKTGNLLTYDPETGELDETSRAILKDPTIIQRLIDNNMILPGGWLTSEAKKRCGGIEKKHKKQAADDYMEQKASPNPDSQTDENPGRLLKDKHQSKDEAEKSDFDGQNLQAFFENLTYNNPEPMSKDMNLANDSSVQKPEENRERLSQDKQQTNFASEPAQEQKLEEDQKSVGTGETPLKDTASIRPLRRFDRKTDSNPEEEDDERPGRKKKGSGGSGGDIIEPPKFSMRDVFHTIFKHKLEIFIFFFSVLLIVAIGTFLAKPVYQATAQLLVKIGRESIFVPATGNMNPVISYNREERINSEIEILKSRAVVEKLLTAMGPTVIYESLKENDNSGILSRLFPDRDSQASPDEIASMRFRKATKMIQEALQVDSIVKSDVIQINFQHEDPQMAATVVNKLADIYLERHLEVHKATKNVKFFQDQSQRLKDNLEKSEEKLESLKEQHNISHLAEERSLLLRETSNLQAELNKTLSQEIENEKRILQIERQLSSIPKTISRAEETDQNPYLINTLEARLVELQLKEKELLAKYTDESRLVRNVKDEIRIVKQKLKEQENKNYGRTSVGLNPTYQRLQETLFEDEADLKAIRAKAQNQKNQLAEYKIKLDKLNQIEVSLNQLQQQVDVDRQNYKLYLTKFEESRISEAMDSEKIANVSLIQPASPPSNPISPNVKLNIMLAIFLGAFGGIGIAFSLEYIDDKIEKVEDVEEKLKLPVLASIPVFRKKATA